jgi:hypothetical protein
MVQNDISKGWKININKVIKGRMPWKKSRPLSEETKKKISESKKGHVPWNKGKTGIYSETTLRNQRKLAKKRWRNPYYRKRITEFNRGKHPSEETRIKLSEIHKGQIPWNKGKTGIFSKETIMKMSEVHKGLVPWSKGKHLSEETKKKISESGKGRKGYWNGKHHSKETIELFSKMRKGSKGYWKGKHLSEEHKIKLSERFAGRPGYWQGKKMSTATRMKMADSHKGAKSSLWQGGIYDRKYNHTFSYAFKELIRERDNWRCYVCNKNVSKKGKSVIHHINYTKEDDRPINVITLCPPCHGATNSDRNYWFAYFCYHLGIELDELAKDITNEQVKAEIELFIASVATRKPSVLDWFALRKF